MLCLPIHGPDIAMSAKGQKRTQKASASFVRSLPLQADDRSHAPASMCGDSNEANRFPECRLCESRQSRRFP
jgi:hypothetical protein